MTDANGAKPPEEAAPEGVDLDLGGNPDTAFASLMDALGASEDDQTPHEGDAPAAAAADGAGQQSAPAEGAAAAAGATATPTAGDDGKPAAPAADAAAAGAAAGTAAPAEGAPGVGEVDGSTLDGDFGAVLTGLETRATENFQREAVEAMRTEYKGYLDLLDQPARMLIGTEVPSLRDPTKNETLRDSQDVKDYQDAVRQVLGNEVRSRVSRSLDDAKPLLDTINGSVELFRANPDIIPGTKQFDKELADRFVNLVKPYEIQSEGKLIGYNVPVQPFLTQLRSEIVATRAAAATAAAATPPAPTAQQQRAAGQQRNERQQFTTPPAADGPQAGIQSKAGNSGEESEDLSTLFGTLGLHDFKF